MGKQSRIRTAGGSLVACSLLLALATLVQVVVVWRAALPSLDAVRFVHLAQLVDQHGLPVLVEYRERPVFPLWLWAVHRALRGIVGPFPAEWAISAQAAAATATILAVIPLYFLCRRLVGPTAGLAGAVLFCVVREVCRLGADGITDSTHLVLLAVALWAIVEYWTRRQAALPEGCVRGGGTILFAAGVASGMAWLTRLEAITIPAALVVAMAAYQILPASRQRWLRNAGQLGSYVLGFAIIYLSYAVALGLWPPAENVSEVAAQEVSRASSVPATSRPDASPWRLPDGEAMSFAVKDPTQSDRHRGYRAAALQFARGVGKAFGPWVGALAVLGIWRLRIRRASMADRFVQIFLAIFSVGAFCFCAQEGYLSSRHLLAWMVVGASCAGYGVQEAGKWLAGIPRLRQLGLNDRLAGVAVAGAAMLACVFALMEPLHGNRVGHRQAARWLASQSDLSGMVLDTRGWTGLYSGHPTYLADQSRKAWQDGRLAYIVVEQSELDYSSARSRTLRWLLETAAERVAAMPDSSPGEARVLVYRWYPERLPWRSVVQWTAR